MDLTKKEKKFLRRIILAFLFFAIVFALDKTRILYSFCLTSKTWIPLFALYGSIYIFIGYDVLLRAGKNIFHAQIFDENFLMCVATLGAFALAIFRGVSGEATDGFDEACAVLIFYQTGEFFQQYATGKSRRSIASLMDIRPDYANLNLGGTTKKVDPNEVKIGNRIEVFPGEKIPLDGIVVAGKSFLDTKAITGESVSRAVDVGSNVISGCVNLSAQITIEVTKEFYDSTISKILELVENASEKKSRAENFITKFAKYYTPIVVFSAVLLAFIPGIIFSDLKLWIYRALNFLVVSCPCALVISIPLSFFAGLGAASKYGILIKGSNFLEKFDRAKIFVFDKTGTLTKGNFVPEKIRPIENQKEILLLAATAEQNSNHPIAKSILKSNKSKIDSDWKILNFSGKGVCAKKGDEKIFCGSEKFLQENGIQFVKENEVGTIVYIAKNKNFVGSILIRDEIKPEAQKVIKALNRANCKTVMFTGDNEKIAKDVAQKIGIGEYHSELLPQEKVSELEKLISQKKPKSEICFVGDGINDAPSLMMSDVGIAMGAIGSDAAVEAGDIVLMRDDLCSILTAKKIAKKTMTIARQNVAFSIFVKLAILIFSAVGLANMWLAVFGDVGVASLAILNAMRVNTKYEN